MKRYASVLMLLVMENDERKVCLIFHRNDSTHRSAGIVSAPDFQKRIVVYRLIRYRSINLIAVSASGGGADQRAAVQSVAFFQEIAVAILGYSQISS